ncbi:MAG: U32 family peptidase [Bacteroidaceae bacterium]|nr:U32 family peptidase [Bacteroidaceae bacterium]
MESETREIELLAPARNAEIGIEAINCGADAVYIGAEAYGARHAAGNRVDDIARLADYAHRYGAKVYVTLNTILYDYELRHIHHLIDRLHDAGADALIVQDTALLTMHLPLPLHASTQMDIRTADKVRQLHRWGFEQAVLARELGLKEMADIHHACPGMKLEAFVHGALCVSYSGRCYASQYCFHRSANRGECAQFCRLAFNLEDDQGNILATNKHLLSLKDMNRSRSVEQMLDAGISSLKIEGRLKDMAYVKNTTAYYSQLLDKIISRRPQHYRRAAYGRCHTTFEPDLNKTFNRGFTDYFLRGRTEDVASIHTPKAVGEPVGTVKEIRNNYILVSGTASFHNGDGLCYFDASGTLQGFRVNRAENNKLYPHLMPQGLAVSTPLFRNHDAAFEAAMLRPTPQRTVSIDLNIEDTDDGFRLTATPFRGGIITLDVKAEHQLALKPQTDRIIAELSKMGGTGLEVTTVTTAFSHDYFIPASLLSQWKRESIEKVRESESARVRTCESGKIKTSMFNAQCSMLNAPFTENISNRAAKQFYEEQGAKEIEPAFELSLPKGNVTLMTCRHCIKYSLGLCVKYDRKTPNSKRSMVNAEGVASEQRERSGNGQWSIVLPDGRRFPLEFDCHKCEMRVTAKI